MRVRFIFFAVLVFIFGCGKESSQIGKNYDSLFLGISFGMDRKEFYDHCWEYNKQKVLTHGPTNQSVEYKLMVLEEPVIMRFYPYFYKDKIYEMPVTYTYKSWAPWNKSFSADTLITELVPVFEKWYGKMTQTKHPSGGIVYVNIENGRRINLFVKDDQFVSAVFTDLNAERELKEELNIK